MSVLRPVALVAASALLASCVMRDDFYALQRQTAQIEQELRASEGRFGSKTEQLGESTAKLDELHSRLRTTFADTNARLDAIEQRLNRLDGALAEKDKALAAQFDDVGRKAEVQKKTLLAFVQEAQRLRDELGEVGAVVRRQAATYASLSSIVAKPSSLPPESAETREARYKDALALYEGGRFDEAIKAFEAFVARYPKDALTGNALYWAGESYYSQKKFREALACFHQVATDFPNGTKAAAALLKEAYTLRELGMKQEYAAALDELVARFPYSDEAKAAKKQRGR